MIPLPETERLLAQLVAYPTVSDRSNLDLIAFVADLLKRAGARVDLFPDPKGQKANLFATLGPDGPGGVVLSAHTDVVPVSDQHWSSDPFRLNERHGLLYGRGTCDMKGFVAAVLASLPAFAARPLNRPLHIALTHDEEVGCIGARALMPLLQARDVRPEVVIVGEPTDMTIVDGHKGCCEYSVHFTGLEGHGSAPALGVNAVVAAMDYARTLLGLADTLAARAPKDSRFSPAFTTVNIGALHGGVSHNVIPGKARLDWEMRPVQWSDVGFVREKLRAFVDADLRPAMRRVHPSADVTTDVIGEVTALVPRAGNRALALVSRLTGANDAHLVPFNTEAGLFQDLGADVVVCGPGSIAQAHKADEFVSRDQLARCLHMLHRLAQDMAA